VRQSAIPVRTCASARHQPARTNHDTFPTTLSVLERVGLWTSAHRNGHSAYLASLSDCFANGRPMIVIASRIAASR
jgi:hypothetical protein